MSHRIGDILVERGLISPAQLADAVRRQQETKEYLGKILVEAGLIDEHKLLEVLAEQQNLEFVDLSEREIPDQVVKRVPAKFARHYSIMPVNLSGNVLTVAIANPFDAWSIDDLASNLGLRVRRVLATAGDIDQAISKYYGVAADAIERIMAEEESHGDEAAAYQVAGQIEDLEKMAESASVVNVVNQILHQAISARATDIHLEYYRDEAHLRYRVDGVLRDAQVSGDIRYLYSAIISRVKIMSGLDIIERRLPQDGRAKVKIGESEYDLRISIIPTIYGENAVIRVLPTQMLYSLADLGMAAADRALMERLIRNTNGIIFVTGPTGSGKSTTLYACLKQLNEKERKLVTIEDPVEYELKGVSQLQVNPKIGLNFARALRSMLRHDPDVIMVGEIRDLETANIAVRAALTGHLVLSTLHTNDAAGAVTRLLDIGIEPFLVASSVRAFIAQRLVRLVCSDCKESYEVEPEVLKQFADAGGFSGGKRGRGCEKCGDSGYLGRTGVYEILPVSDEIRELIIAKSSAAVIRQRALDAGMRTLKHDGFAKACAGLTTLEEVLRVTQVE